MPRSLCDPGPNKYDRPATEFPDPWTPATDGVSFAGSAESGTLEAMSAEPVFSDGMDDFTYPAPDADVLPRCSSRDLRELLVQRSQWANEHPDELLTTSQVYDMMMSRIGR